MLLKGCNIIFSHGSTKPCKEKLSWTQKDKSALGCYITVIASSYTWIKITISMIPFFWNCATDRLVWFWKLQVIMNKEKTHFVFLNSWQMRNIYYIACKYQVFSVTKLISGGVYWVELTWIEVYEAWEAWNWKLTHKEEAFKSSYIGNYQKSCSLIFISAAKLLPSLAMPFNSSPVGGGEKGEVQKSRKN